MTRSRMNRKTSPIHRIGLTHGREGVPKFIRENTDQFFAAATRRKSKIISASKSTESQQQQYQSKQTINVERNKENSQLTIPISKPLTPMIIPHPIRTASSQRPKPVSSASVCIHQPTLLPPIISPNNSLESSTPLIKTPTLLPSLKRQIGHGGPIDQDIFRKAYERALSVARSRLLFRDPYSLTRTNATHGILYSYYDHTPMCIFSRGTACNHRQDNTIKPERKPKANFFRKKIFNDVIVEHYIQ